MMLGLAIVIGVAWGAATSGLQTVLPSSGLADAVSPWLAPALMVGALSRRPWAAVVAGALVCCGEVGGYYATSALRGFGINPAMVALWAVTGVVGGPVFGAAGWCWRRARSLWWAALGAALLGGVFLTEGLVQYGAVLHYTGNAVVFSTLGVLAVGILGAAAPAAREAGAPGRGAGAAAAWSLPVLVLGAAGEAALLALTA